MFSKNPRDFADSGYTSFDMNVSKSLDAQVSAEDVPNVEAVVEDILAHPHRKHFATLAVPTPADKRSHENIFAMGIPRNVMFGFAHWFRMSQPLESAREKFLLCKEKAKSAGGRECVDEALHMHGLYQQLAELPFRACPEAAARYVYCIDTVGRVGAASAMEGQRSQRDFVRHCGPEQEHFEGCMAQAFPGASFPPTPRQFTRFNSSFRFTNFVWDRIYS
eukprot:TRINITY_DN6490_c0_g1_i1.p1 TRINITY_DN6490_c0_g1~~TRINITY_DN6490_c0_g1_i1.p1  ORF type:complete len:238 (+),score=61.41 TRINITY_DN6490_c0_g1_i1:56-715(+)